MIRRFVYCIFALLVAIGATGAELQLPQWAVQGVMTCDVAAEGTCPCGMPMPQRGPQPCNTSLVFPVAAPTRTAPALVEQVTTAVPPGLEPKPWPAAWTLPGLPEAERGVALQPIPADTGPPLLASERSAHLRVFRI